MKKLSVPTRKLHTAILSSRASSLSDRGPFRSQLWFCSRGQCRRCTFGRSSDSLFEYRCDRDCGGLRIGPGSLCELPTNGDCWAAAPARRWSSTEFSPCLPLSPGRADSELADRCHVAGTSASEKSRWLHASESSGGAGRSFFRSAVCL